MLLHDGGLGLLGPVLCCALGCGLGHDRLVHVGLGHGPDPWLEIAFHALVVTKPRAAAGLVADDLRLLGGELELAGGLHQHQRRRLASAVIAEDAPTQTADDR